LNEAKLDLSGDNGAGLLNDVPAAEFGACCEPKNEANGLSLETEADGATGAVSDALLLDLEREGESAEEVGMGGGGGGNGSVESRLEMAYDGNGGLLSADDG
jgi:hypothetical protein